MSDKTEKPSPRRLRQARQRGDIPVSAALTQAGASIAAVAALPAAVSWAAQECILLVRSAIASELGEPKRLLAAALMLSLPVLVAAAVGAMTVGFAQTGGWISLSKLTPKLASLDPVEGFRRLFEPERLFQALRALLAVCLLAWLSGNAMLDDTQSIANTLGRPELAAALAGSLTREVLWGGAAIATGLGVVDVLVVRRSWWRRNRMSKHDLQREHKESEGDPGLKRERKRAHQEMLSHALVLSVKEAKVVIVNPAHLATALRYETDRDETPIVVAQGRGELARSIVDAARGYGIPVIRDITVARGLWELDVGDPIPEELYAAVAEILNSLSAQEGGQALDSPVT